MLTGNKLGEAIEAARIKKGLTKKAIADAFGVKPPSVQDWVKRGTIDKEKLPILWRLFSDVVGPEHWGLEEFPWGKASGHLDTGVEAALIAHAVSSLQKETVPSFTWEQLMSEDPQGALPRVFRVAAPDESMAPKVKAGSMLLFSTVEAARPGDGVLLRDRTGQVHFRIYRAGRPGVWVAHAENPAYAPLESERDGLSVIAVLMAVEARWG